MAEASANIRLTLDGQQAMQTAERLKGKISDASTAAGALAKNWEMGAGLLAKQLVGVMAIVAGIRQAVSAAADLRKEQGEAFQKGRGAERAFLVAANRAKLPAGDIRQIQQDVQDGSATYEQAASMIDKAREAKIRSPQEIRRAVRLAGSGLFQDDEIINKERRRVLDQATVDARFSAMGGFAAERARERDARAADITFGVGGANEDLVTRRTEALRRSGGVSAAIGAIQPDIINRSDASFGLVIEQLGRSMRDGIKVKSDKPQVGSRENAP